MSANQTDIAEMTEIDIDEPPMWKVIYHNDDRTSMEFVIESLVQVFEYDAEDAYTVTMKIHEEENAVVAVLPYEIAEQKAMEVMNAAEHEGYPLRLSIEPE